MRNGRVLWKALCTSTAIRGPFSMAVGILGFAAAFLPVWTARQLQALTDALQALAGGGGDTGRAATLFVALVALYLMQLVFANLQGYVGGMDEINIGRFLKRTILRHKCGVRYQYVENDDDFPKRIAFIEQYAGYQMAKSIGGILTILQRFVGFLAASLALWQVSPVIVLVLVATSVPAALLSYYQQDETFRGRVKWMEEGALAIHYFALIGGHMTMDGLQEIRHFALFDYLKARWRAIADDYVGKKNRLMAKHVRANTAADLLRSVVYLVILLAAAWSIYQNPALGLGVFTLVFALSADLQTMTADCLVQTMVLVADLPYLREFFALDELERDPGGRPGASAQGGDIVFAGVEFAYPGGGEPVLRDINVRIRAGEKVAIVGENGSGKSTFISLLCGMFCPQHGRVEVGGIDLGREPGGAREAVSVVFQDFARYEATLRENITVSDRKRQANDGQIEELLRLIRAEDIVSGQQQGLDTQIGSFGDCANDLSGGQWQKISIARAAYRSQARIMVLDEPTAALDPLAEAQLYRNFSALTGDRTTLLISHRLGIATLVDRILVFRDGRIVEDGSHRELMEKNGHYARMYRAQAQWYA